MIITDDIITACELLLQMTSSLFVNDYYR
jgi:hypothetical protein